MYRLGAKKTMLKENVGKFRIGIFREAGFPASGIPANLTPEWFASVLEQDDDMCVVFLDEQEMTTYSLVRPYLLDLIILPYGEAFISGGFAVGAFQMLRSFLQDGGSLMTTGGRPFWRPLGRNDSEDSISDEVWQAAEHEPYDKFLAELGIKYYELENEPADFIFDTEMLPGCPKWLGKDGATIGLTVTTSDEYAVPNPPCGNVFPDTGVSRSF